MKDNVIRLQANRAEPVPPVSADVERENYYARQLKTSDLIPLLKIAERSPDFYRIAKIVCLWARVEPEQVVKNRKKV